MKQITLHDYFAGYPNHKDITPEVIARATMLLKHVNEFLTELCESNNCDLDINPVTGTLISGTKNGGFRPRDCTDGAWGSSHKDGSGVDVFDSDGDLDSSCTDALLAKHGLYREHPSQTRSWMHLTTRAPRSGRRTFYA
jgi:hypothetical protein